ncbi:5852_t:CDS:2 [Acaulospora colombiana]|uniref:5852_t:CDS:1 n=1 Tax=Acaulospora colombiana TaxID=27376 RepID=A0ACA9P9G2_9GLOM|nr:5852_t:CDS:2 [Acaulospora colombiana]
MDGEQHKKKTFHLSSFSLLTWIKLLFHLLTNLFRCLIVLLQVLPPPSAIHSNGKSTSSLAHHRTVEDDLFPTNPSYADANSQPEYKRTPSSSAMGRLRAAEERKWRYVGDVLAHLAYYYVSRSYKWRDLARRSNKPAQNENQVWETLCCEWLAVVEAHGYWAG